MNQPMVKHELTLILRLRPAQKLPARMDANTDLSAMLYPLLRKALELGLAAAF